MTEELARSASATAAERPAHTDCRANASRTQRRSTLEEHNDALIVAQVIVMRGTPHPDCPMPSFVDFASPSSVSGGVQASATSTGRRLRFLSCSRQTRFTHAGCDHPVRPRGVEAGPPSAHSGRKTTRQANTKWCRRPSLRCRSTPARRPHHGLSPNACTKRSHPNPRRRARRCAARERTRPLRTRCRRTPLVGDCTRETQRRAQGSHITNPRHRLVPAALALSHRGHQWGRPWLWPRR